MKHVILMIVLAVLKESYPLNPEILKYDQYMKDFETTGRQLKREKNKEMNPIIVKREDQKPPGQEEPIMVPKTSLGCSSLAAIRTNGAIYVDRTETAYNIITDEYRPISIFLRPRRFGKTLLIDVFQTILRHNKEDLGVLRGTYVHSLAEHLPTYTVLRFNFQDQNTIERLDERLMEHARFYNVSDKFMKLLEDTCKGRRIRQRDQGVTVINKKPIDFFPLLVEVLEKPVAVLVDEYNVVFDVRDDEATVEYFTQFFRSLKDLKARGQLGFAFITGCDKVKINLKEYNPNHGLGTTLGIDDISGDTKFAHLLGFTEGEIRKYYHGLAQRKAKACNVTVEEIYKRMKSHYNGYQFGKNDSPLVYNPLSVMKYLIDEENIIANNYWVNTVPDSNRLERLLIENNIMNLNKDVLNLDAYFTEDELFDRETKSSLEDKSHKLGVEAVLYRQGYLTTANITITDEGILRQLRFPNNEALGAFKRALTNALAKSKEAAELSKKAWRSLDKKEVDVDGFSNAFNDFIKLPACRFLIKYVSKEFETLYKNFVETMMGAAKCNDCNVHREERLLHPSKEGENLPAPNRPDFVFDTQDKRIYVEFKYESSETNFKGKYFNQLKRYKFHACKTPHPNGEKVRKIKILINFNSNGNMAQWYGPKDYEFDTEAEDDKSATTERFEENYLATQEPFPTASVRECEVCKPPLALTERGYKDHMRTGVHRPCPKCGGRDDISNMGNLGRHIKSCTGNKAISSTSKPSPNI